MMYNFFEIKSVAIIGASANPKKLGYQITANLKTGGFEGKIFPINLDETKILGLPVHQTVLDIHRPIDLATIIVPREVVPLVLKQCVLKEIPYCLIITAGFAEKDKKGAKLQDELNNITKRSKTRIIGPNCLGLINTQDKLNLTFAASKVTKGNIGLILQSGAIGAAILDWAKENEIGISKFVSLGNKVQISELEALKILGEDPQTKVIALYLEEITDPRQFLEIAKMTTGNKPVIILKGGETKQGSLAARSHTAALAGSEELDTALFNQANLIIAHTYEDLLNLLELCSAKNFSVTKKNLAIVTNAGGPGILAADAASRNNMHLVRLKGFQKKNIEKNLDSFSSLKNPFDLGGDAHASRIEKMIEMLEKIPELDSIIVIVTPQATTELEKTAKVISRFKSSSKPIVASFLGGQKIKKAVKILSKAHVPHFEDPSMAIEQLSIIYKYFHKKDKIDHSTRLPTKLHRFDSPEEIITNYKIPFVETISVDNSAETMAAVEEIGFPLIYKTGKDVKSKQKTGKVGLNIADNVSLDRSINAIGYPGIIQPMIDSIYEIMVGAKRDDHFGIVLVFGRGGIFIEEKKDVCFKILPLTANDLEEMIEETEIFRAISDFKVKDKIKEAIINVAAIMVDNPDIREIEFNPFKVAPNKIIAVDINIVRKNNE